MFVIPFRIGWCLQKLLKRIPFQSYILQFFSPARCAQVASSIFLRFCLQCKYSCLFSRTKCFRARCKLRWMAIQIFFLLSEMQNTTSRWMIAIKRFAHSLQIINESFQFFICKVSCYYVALWIKLMGGIWNTQVKLQFISNCLNLSNHYRGTNLHCAFVSFSAKFKMFDDVEKGFRGKSFTWVMKS